METIIYKIENEIEYLRITSALQEMKVEYSENKYSDSSFPVLNESEYFAEISVSKEDEETIKAIINNKIVENYSITTENVSNKKIKYNYVIISLVIYGLITTFLCAYIWYSEKRISLDKNFDNQLNTERTILTIVNEKSGKTAALYFDENYDLNWELLMTFSKDGEQTGIYYDNNEDGYWEKSSLYNKHKQKILSLFDTNNDGIYDKFEVLLNVKDTAKYKFNKNSSFFELDYVNKNNQSF